MNKLFSIALFLMVASNVLACEYMDPDTQVFISIQHPTGGSLDYNSECNSQEAKFQGDVTVVQTPRARDCYFLIDTSVRIENLAFWAQFDAINEFLDLADPSLYRVSLITYGETGLTQGNDALLRLSLTNDFDLVRETLDEIELDFRWGEPYHELALELVAEEYSANGDVGREQWAMMFTRTDWFHNPARVDVESANLADLGVTVDVFSLYGASGELGLITDNTGGRLVLLLYETLRARMGGLVQYGVTEIVIRSYLLGFEDDLVFINRRGGSNSFIAYPQMEAGEMVLEVEVITAGPGSLSVKCSRQITVTASPHEDLVGPWLRVSKFWDGGLRLLSDWSLAPWSGEASFLWSGSDGFYVPVTQRYLLQDNDTPVEHRARGQHKVEFFKVVSGNCNEHNYP